MGLAVPLQSDGPFASLPFSAQFAPHQLAYLPQTPLFMVYSGHVPEGINQRSPVSGHREGNPKKRERQEEEEDDQAAKRSKRSVSIESETVSVMSLIKTLHTCIHPHRHAYPRVPTGP